MAAPPYMKLYVGDYLGDTHHLGVIEHGAYLLLLMSMWRAGGSLPATDANLAKLARCSPDQWAEIRGSVLPFFKQVRGRLTHKRIAEEMAKYESTSGKRSEAGKRGVAKKAMKNNASTEAIASGADSNCAHNQNQNQRLSPQPPDGGVSDEAFEAIWAAYPPMGRGTCAKALGRRAVDDAVRAGDDPAVMLAGAREADGHTRADGKPKRFDRWVKDRLYLNAATPAAPSLSAAPWPGPPEVWALAVERQGEPWARGHVGRCTWSDGVLMTSSPTVARAIQRELGAALGGQGHRVEVRGATA